MVEENRSCPGDLPKCKNLCTLQGLQRRLMFVGELPPADGEDVGGEGGRDFCLGAWVPVSDAELEEERVALLFPVP